MIINSSILRSQRLTFIAKNQMMAIVLFVAFLAAILYNSALTFEGNFINVFAASSADQIILSFKNIAVLYQRSLVGPSSSEN